MSNKVTIKKRDHEIVQQCLAGEHYKTIAEQHGITKRQVYRILKKDEIKDIVDTGFNQMVSNIPLACEVVQDTLKDKKEKALRYKASQDVLKLASIIPSNTENKTITTIYNIQNNNVLSPTVLKALLPNYQDDPDIIDADYQDKEIA